VLAKKDPIEQNWRKLGPIWTQPKLGLIWKKLMKIGTKKIF